MNYKILYMEDEDTIRDVLSEYMTIAGYDVDLACDGEEALEKLRANKYDMAILDIMVPKISGLEVLETIEKEDIQCAVLMLTALDDEKTQVIAFNKKADDFVVKPVSPIILLKRIETILRRTSYIKNNNEAHGNDINKSLKKESLTINKESYRAYYDGKELNLTLSEFLLLDALMERPDMVFTRDQLITKIFNDEYITSDRIIDTHVKNLRKKLPKNYIKTVIGIGYQFDKDV